MLLYAYMYIYIQYNRPHNHSQKSPCIVKTPRKPETNRRTDRQEHKWKDGRTNEKTDGLTDRNLGHIDRQAAIEMLR